MSLFADTSLLGSSKLAIPCHPLAMAQSCLPCIPLLYLLFFVTQLARNSSKTMAHLCLSSPKANDLQISSTPHQVRVRICKSSHSAPRFVVVKVLVKDESCWFQITEALSLTQNLSAALAKQGVEILENHFLPTLKNGKWITEPQIILSREGPTRIIKLNS